MKLFSDDEYALLHQLFPRSVVDCISRHRLRQRTVPGRKIDYYKDDTLDRTREFAVARYDAEGNALENLLI